jgi:nitrogen fixation-related uncharacterized protein
LPAAGARLGHPFLAEAIGLSPENEDTCGRSRESHTTTQRFARNAISVMIEDYTWAVGVMIGLAACSFVWAVVALVWAVKTGQFRDFDRQSRLIFDDYEEEGTRTDHFPGKGPPPSEYLL